MITWFITSILLCSKCTCVKFCLTATLCVLERTFKKGPFWQRTSNIKYAAFIIKKGQILNKKQFQNTLQSTEKRKSAYNHSTCFRSTVKSRKYYKKSGRDEDNKFLIKRSWVRGDPRTLNTLKWKQIAGAFPPSFPPNILRLRF